MKKLGLNGFHSADFSSILKELCSECHNYLNEIERIDLISKVPNKSYFAFKNDLKISRPIRSELFTTDYLILEEYLNCLASDDYSNISKSDINIACYTIAISFCAIIDLNKVGDQKTPGTFFEYFIGHCFASRLKINPRKRVEVLNIEMDTTLPTDFIFDLGYKNPKLHVPVKTSTRERVIQVWAHQRVLDGVYGSGRFLGVLACLSETKLNKYTLEVIEICLPQQWQLYQMYIAQMKRVYYLDLPEAYASLNTEFPKIQVKDFSSFIEESTDFSSL